MTIVISSTSIAHADSIVKNDCDHKSAKKKSPTEEGTHKRATDRQKDRQKTDRKMTSMCQTQRPSTVQKKECKYQRIYKLTHT